MNDDMLNFATRKQEELAPQESTTLIISDVPSKVAYDLLTTALAKGEAISPEEINRAVDARVNGGNISLAFSELVDAITRLPDIGQIEQYTIASPREELDQSSQEIGRTL